MLKVGRTSVYRVLNAPLGTACGAALEPFRASIRIANTTGAYSCLLTCGALSEHPESLIRSGCSLSKPPVRAATLDILAPHGWGVLFLPGPGTIREFYPYCSYHSGSAPRAASLAVVISNTLAPRWGVPISESPTPSSLALRRHPNAARSPSFSIPKLLCALTAQAWNKFLRYVAKPTARF
jgi:hypothetical protein